MQYVFDAAEGRAVGAKLAELVIPRNFCEHETKKHSFQRHVQFEQPWHLICSITYVHESVLVMPLSGAGCKIRSG